MAWRSFNALVNDPQLLIFDSREQSHFAVAHIRNAVCVRVKGASLEYVMGAVWSQDYWWGRDVLLVPGVWPTKEEKKEKEKEKKRKASEVIVDPVAKFLMEENRVKSLKIMEDEEGGDPFACFSKRYPFIICKSVKPWAIPSYPAEIIPRFLYMGTWEHANSVPILNDLHITYVLTAHTERLKEIKGCTHKYFDIFDEPNANITQYFEPAFEFIEEAKRAKARVLVHCGAGASRSVTLCAYYLMRVQHWGVDETIKFLKEQRKEVDPNPGFIKQLREVERKRSGRPAKEFVVEVHKSGQIVDTINPCEKEELIFGRQTTCDVVLDHASISRQHAKLLWSGESLHLVDMDSVHGTFVNKKRVGKSRQELQDGDFMAFGASTRKYVVREI
ncbi:protein phosphatase Slingshot homolog [Selaginella moellendorffii]|nr:protein phosphatase Slingshot homolog [Selaginella moellendorffii]|eukprot:XP_002967725.2 protein phosphatase Slingshot homolog [Selaginella moellendorffii]